MRTFHKNSPLKYLLFAVIGVIISIPLSTLILQLIHHKGGHDYIHSTKSGILMPFWIFSVGLLIIGQKLFFRQSRQSHLGKRGRYFGGGFVNLFGFKVF